MHAIRPSPLAVFTIVVSLLASFAQAEEAPSLIACNWEKHGTLGNLNVRNETLFSTTNPLEAQVTYQVLRQIDPQLVGEESPSRPSAGHYLVSRKGRAFPIYTITVFQNGLSASSRVLKKDAGFLTGVDLGRCEVLVK